MRRVWVLPFDLFSPSLKMSGPKKSKVPGLRQGSLPSHDEVRPPVLEDQPGVGLDPDPGAALGQQPEDGEAALARFYH